MVELHLRDVNSGEVYRAIYDDVENAQAQAAHDIEVDRWLQPFAVVEHDESKPFDGANYDASAYTVVAVVDQAVLDKV